MSRRSMLVGLLALAALAVPGAALAHHRGGAARHVLLISVDGLHASDLSQYVASHPGSTLASLSGRGTTYERAAAPLVTDSFPGLLALVTGGTPKSTGVYYDNSYDRTLFAPGSNCQGQPGTNVVYDESIDVRPEEVDSGGIDPAKLPLAKTPGGCVPVYPHSYLRDNTIFEVAHQAGLRTAWSDKHPAYDLVNGPSGHGVDDLFTPEINGSIGGVSIVTTVATTEAYDATKVKAIVNEVGGLDSSGAHQVGTPAVFGMNFQSVSVAEKLPFQGSSDVGGYFAGGAFTPQLAGALDFVDSSLAQVVDALRSHGLLGSTEIVITAKHGQSPIDPTSHVRVSPDVVPGIVQAAGAPVAQATEDDAALLWLADSGQAEAAASALRADRAGANTGHIGFVISGALRNALFADPRVDPRVPDVLVEPQHGVVYSLSTKKVAEHGGAAPDDRHVALLVVPPTGSHGPRQVDWPVWTTQVAPSVLSFLGLNPEALRGVRLEGTRALPGR
jgi:hypothetical protein